MVEGDRLLGLRHVAYLLAGHRSGVGIAEHFDIAAERHRAHLPARAGAIIPAEELGAEADREGLDPDAVTPRDQVMPEFVHEHEHGQHQQESNEVAEATGQPEHERTSILSRGAGQSEVTSRMYPVFGNNVDSPGPELP